MHILFCWKNQKNVLQKGKKDWIFEVFLFAGELIPAEWIIENDLCQTLCVDHKFFAKRRGFGLFFATQRLAQTQ